MKILKLNLSTSPYTRFHFPSEYIKKRSFSFFKKKVVFSFSFLFLISYFYCFIFLLFSLSLPLSLSLSLHETFHSVDVPFVAYMCRRRSKKKETKSKKQTNKTQNQISDAHYIVTAVESKYFVLLYIFLQKSFVINSRHNFLFSFAHATFDSPSLNCDGFHLFSLVFCCVCVCVCVCFCADFLLSTTISSFSLSLSLLVVSVCI